MGNHEWCPNCEMDDYHREFECDPKRVIARITREKRAAERKRVATAKMVFRLQECNIPYEIDQYGNAVIRPWSF